MKKFLSIIIILFLFICESHGGDDNSVTFDMSCEQQIDKKANCEIAIDIKDGVEMYGHSIENGDASLSITLNENNSNNIDTIDVIWPLVQGKTYENKTIIPLILNLNDDGEYKTTLKISYAICSTYCAFEEREIIYDSKNAHDRIKTNKENNNFYYICLIALLGGLILNFMPCVLPLITIKTIHIATKNNRLELLFVCLGIIFSFIILASINVLLKSFGYIVGWGMHFQEPFFIMFLLSVIIFAIASISGLVVINLPQWVIKFSEKFNSKNLLSEFFFGGFLVLLATPCTAPFLGTAVAFAMMQDITTIYIIYLLIGIGMSIPYIGIMLIPSSVNILKKVKFLTKYCHSIIVATLLIIAGWLIYILSSQIAWWCIILFLSVIFSAIGYIGRETIMEKFTKRNSGIGVIVVIIIAAIFYQFYNPTNDSDKLLWEDFDQQKLSEIIESNKTVIVNITASWCITCQVNEKRVFENEEVIKKLKKLVVILIKGDYTSHSNDLLSYITQNDKSGVPLTVVYGNAKKIILPVMFNKEELFNTLESVNNINNLERNE